MNLSPLSDKFPADTTDIEWMAQLDREGGWAVLTKDLRMQFRPHERLALDRSKIVFFFLAGAWRKYAVPETAARLIRLVPLMVKQVEIADRGRFDLPINAGSKLRPHRD
jgi:PIN like domain